MSASNAKIIFVSDNCVDRVLGDDLKAVVRRRLQNLDHRLVNDVTDRAPMFGGHSLDEIDACEWHVRSSLTIWRTHSRERRRRERSGPGPLYPLMRIPVLLGRGVTEHDTASNAWVVVINQAMAKRYWPNQDPIGQAIKFDDSPDEKPRQIVGVVQDVKQSFPTEPAQPEAFVPYQQLSSRIYPGWTEARVHKSIIIRTHADPKALMQSMRRVISDLAPESAIFGITTVQQTVSQSATPWRFLSQVLELFAGIALLLAVIGTYGVISYSIGERRHELGLRIALGAQPRQVLGLVLRQAMTLSLIGVVIGIAGSFAATPLLAKFLYGVKAHDTLTLVLVSSLLMAATFVASYIPARHATKIDPMQTLRHE